jgi:hypothetical protein
MINNIKQKRRDWSLIILILPLGVAMMLCVGQLAIRMAPNWSVSGEMNSSLDPETAPKQNALIIPPISSDILTPVSWWGTFLTPSDDSGGGVVFPPFITFEPSLTPTDTASPSPTTPSPTSTVTATGTPPSPTPTATKKPKDDTCQNPSANNFGGPLPCTFPPTTCTDPAATNNGGPLPCTYPPTTCTDPAASNNGFALPCRYPVTSTPVGIVATVPPQTTIGTPDGNVGGVSDGNYFVLALITPIVVNGPPDTNYDFVYYERATGGGIDFDSVVISISMDNSTYYMVFNWGDGAPDNNSNVGDVVTNTGTENDNQHIDASELHDPDGAGPAPDTGILVDVDNAPSNPPPGNYFYVAIQAPAAPPSSGNDGADLDSIEVVENTPAP